jgi:hypothetical protein
LFEIKNLEDLTVEESKQLWLELTGTHFCKSLLAASISADCLFRLLL